MRRLYPQRNLKKKKKSWNLFVTPTLIKDHGKAESGGFTGFNPGTRAPGEGPGYTI